MSTFARHVITGIRMCFNTVRPGERFITKDGYIAKPKTSVWYRIEDLDAIRSILKSNGIRMSPRFRGPRTTSYHPTMNYKRSLANMQSICLKSEAKFFSIRIEY